MDSGAGERGVEYMQGGRRAVAALAMSASASGTSRPSQPRRKWKRPSHAQVVAAIAALPGIALLAGHRHLPTAISFALAHGCATGVAVSIASCRAFAGSTTGMLGKSSRGRIPLWSIALFFPFHAALRAKLWLKKHVLSREPLHTDVGDGWHIGGWPPSAAALPAGDPAVVDCTCEFQRTHSHVPYLCVPTWDTQCPSDPGFRAGVDFAVAQHESGRPVYVHCAHGHGRSAAMLCAILIATGASPSVEAAEAMLKHHRPKVRLNQIQLEGLRAYLGKNK